MPETARETDPFVCDMVLMRPQIRPGYLDPAELPATCANEALKTQQWGRLLSSFRYLMHAPVYARDPEDMLGRPRRVLTRQRGKGDKGYDESLVAHIVDVFTSHDPESKSWCGLKLERGQIWSGPRSTSTCVACRAVAVGDGQGYWCE